MAKGFLHEVYYRQMLLWSKQTKKRIMKYPVLLMIVSSLHVGFVTKSFVSIFLFSLSLSLSVSLSLSLSLTHTHTHTHTHTRMHART